MGQRKNMLGLSIAAGFPDASSSFAVRQEVLLLKLPSTTSSSSSKSEPFVSANELSCFESVLNVLSTLGVLGIRVSEEANPWINSAAQLMIAS
jgi:hypothetical protein